MKTVILLDDDHDSRAALAELIRSPLRRIIELADGIDCIPLLDHVEPDAMVLDLDMPVFDGERLLDYISVTYPALLERVIVVSGFAAAFRGRDWPVAAVLGKPVETERLLALLSEHA